MLRRKLLAILGSIVLLLLAVAVTAIFLLQGVLSDLTYVRNEAVVAVDQVSRLSGEIGLIQIELYRLQLGNERHLDTLLDSSERMQKLVDGLGSKEDEKLGLTPGMVNELRERLPAFYSSVAALATSQDESLAWQNNQRALSAAVDMNRAILRISQSVREHADVEQAYLVSRFRWIVLGLGLAFLLLINVSILILLRAAEMVLRPIDQLVDASRRLSQEQFDTRVTLEQNDEFGQLAGAFNSLAQNLQASEERKLETLGQVALTLNHELNNAMAIIQLQLDLLKRRGDEGQEKYLRQIRENLERMAYTVEQLKRVRRIVLTDYVPGQQMIDLAKSTEAEPQAKGEGPEAK